MATVLYLGKITGVSSMFAEGRHRGYVRHSISIYKDFRQNRAVAGGRIWGNASVLRHGVTGRPIVLSFADGTQMEVKVERMAVEHGYSVVATSDPIPRFRVRLQGAPLPHQQGHRPDS